MAANSAGVCVHGQGSTFLDGRAHLLVPITTSWGAWSCKVRSFPLSSLSCRQGSRLSGFHVYLFKLVISASCFKNRSLNFFLLLTTFVSLETAFTFAAKLTTVGLGLLKVGCGRGRHQENPAGSWGVRLVVPVRRERSALGSDLRNCNARSKRYSGLKTYRRAW